MDTTRCPAPESHRLPRFVFPTQQGARGWVEGHEHVIAERIPSIGDTVEVITVHGNPSLRNWVVVPCPWAKHDRATKRCIRIAWYKNAYDRYPADALDIDIWIAP